MLDQAQGLAPLGLVAGHGELPLQFCRAVRARGRRIVAVGLRDEADDRLPLEVDACAWRNVGQLKSIMRALQQAGVQEACLLGGVRKRRWFRHGRPDALALRLLWSLNKREDDALLRAIARAFDARGIRIIESLPYLAQIVCAAGTLGRYAPTPAQQRDIAHGFDACRSLGTLDIGQCVVVKDGAVVAVEAVEGTDACIARAGALCEARGLVVVKAAKPAQDMRFDVPTVGPQTIEAMRMAGADVLALEAGRVMVVEPQKTVALADAAGIVVYGFKSSQASHDGTSLGEPAL